MIYFSLLVSSFVLWIALFFTVNQLIRPNLSEINLKYLHRRIVRLVDWAFIVSVCFYQLFLIHLKSTFDAPTQNFLQHSQVSFFSYELFLFIFWLKNFNILSLIHHIVTITVILTVLHLNIMLEESSYEWLLLEATILFLHLRDILRDFNQKYTKSLLIIEFTYPFLFIFTKIVLRIIFMYYELFVWKANNIVIIHSIVIQILFISWSWMAWRSFKSNLNSGYLTWSNLKTFPWLIL